MQEIKLDKYLKTNSQAGLARAIGTTAAAVNLWIKRGKKEIFVHVNDDGKVIKVIEHRRLPSRSDHVGAR